MDLVTLALAKSYIDKKINEEGIVTGATPQQAAQIEQNKADIADLQAEIGGNYVKSVNGMGPDESGNIEIPAGVDVSDAQAGQIIIVKSVDENGKPTEWEAIDKPVYIANVRVDRDRYSFIDGNHETLLNAYSSGATVGLNTSGYMYYLHHIDDDNNLYFGQIPYSSIESGHSTPNYNLMVAPDNSFTQFRMDIATKEFVREAIQEESNKQNEEVKTEMSNLSEQIAGQHGELLAAIEQAVFDKALLASILNGTCENLSGDAITEIGDYVFYMKKSLKTVDLPNCISIGTNAFYYCSALAELNIPKLTSIPENAFVACGLTEVSFPEVTNIGVGGFAACSGLISVDIPKLTGIEERGLLSTGLTEVNFPSLTYIGKKAFSSCKNLKKVWLPATVETIYTQSSYTNSPFLYCDAGVKIFCEATEAPSGWGVFWNNYGSSTSARLEVVYGATYEDFLAYDPDAT